MEYHFEEVSTSNIRALTELNYRMGLARTLIPVVVNAIMTLYVGYLWLFGGIEIYWPILMVLLTAYVALAPYFAALNSIKRMKHFYHGQLPTMTARFGQQIYLQTQDSAATREYEQIAKVYSFQYSYCLILANKTAIMLDRNGFTKGTFAEFKQFLRHQRPDLLIPE